MHKNLIATAALLLSAATVTACSGNKDYLFLTSGEKAQMEREAAAKALAKEHARANDYYEVHAEDGRVYVFDDPSTYTAFLAHGETAYRLVRIGEGPEGKTLVFGLTGKDKKKRSGIAAVDMWDGKLAGAPQGFYAEIIYEGRFYVFSEWADLQSFKQTWEAPYRFTRIGEGPGGRTIVFVLNGSNKKKQPTALIERFKATHAAS